MEISEDKTYGVCEYCGSTMTLPKVSDDQRAAAFNRGNHFRRIGEFDKALQVYERIVREDDSDAEAHWCCALCRFGIEYVEDPASYEYIPTCHRASFDNFLEDVDYLAAVEYSDGITRRQYQKDGAKIAEVQRGILATSQNEEPYDVFICYKESDGNGGRTVDSVLAQDIYERLTEKGRKVFFARITLEEKAGTEFEPYIFAALNSAKVMVVVGTSAENLNAVWVKNEWSRFLAMMKHNRNKILLPCYRDMDPYDLPDQLGVLQSYDMSKIGFIQDLTRGISKVLDADKQTEITKTVVVQQGDGTNTEALLKRGYMALKDEEWNKADNFFEEVLNHNPECADAYLGKVLAKEQQPSLKDFISLRQGRIRLLQPETAYAIQENTKFIDQTVAECTRGGILDEKDIRKNFSLYDRSYQAYACVYLKAEKAECEYWKSDSNLGKALQFASGTLKLQLEQGTQYLIAFIQGLKNKYEAEERKAKEKIQSEYPQFLEYVRKACTDEFQKRAEEKYQEALNKEKEKDFTNAAEFYRSLLWYKDSAVKLKECQKKIAANAKRVKWIRVLIVAVITVALILVSLVSHLIQDFIIPETKYKEAEQYLEEGNYEYAIDAFEKLRGYKDSEERIEEVYTARKNASLEAVYQKAELLRNKGQYDEAMETLQSISEYKDSTEKIARIQEEKRESLYNEALMLAENNNFAEAEKRFTELDNYKDSLEQKKIVLYNHASALLKQNSYDDAIKILENLKDFRDSKDLYIHSCYTYAEKLKESGNEKKAAILFGKCGDYKDAKIKSWNLWPHFAVRNTVAGSQDQIFGVMQDGTVLATEYRGAIDHNREQCNVSDWENIVAVSSGYAHIVGLRNDGTVVASGHTKFGQCNVSGWKDIVAISAGTFYTVGLKADGTVIAVGDNDKGQCDVDEWNDIVAISAGSDYTLGLKADGTVVAAGENRKGCCNVDHWENIVAIDNAGYSVGLTSGGKVLTQGETCYGSGEVNDWNNIIAVSAEGRYTAGLCRDGTVCVTYYNVDNRDYLYFGWESVDNWSNIVAIDTPADRTIGLSSDGKIHIASVFGDEQKEVNQWPPVKIPEYRVR